MTLDFEKGYHFFKQHAYPEALHHFRLAYVESFVRDRDRNSVAYVGYCHQKGLGTAKDPYTALQWYRLALEGASEKWQQSWVADRVRDLEQLAPEPICRPPYEFTDCRIGKIVNQPDKKPFQYRIKEGVVYVNGLERLPYDSVVQRLMNVFQQRERERHYRSPVEQLDGDFFYDRDHFRARVVRGNGNRFVHTINNGEYLIHTPADAVFEHLAVRETLFNYLRRLVKTAAQAYLIPRVAYWAQKTGLCNYSKVEVCYLPASYGTYYYDSKIIKLDTKLILEPSLFIDAVIVHELCHQRVRGHGTAFYEALRKYGGEELYRADQRR